MSFPEVDPSISRSVIMLPRWPAGKHHNAPEESFRSVSRPARNERGNHEQTAHQAQYVDNHALHVFRADRDFRHGQAPGKHPRRSNHDRHHQEEKEKAKPATDATASSDQTAATDTSAAPAKKSKKSKKTAAADAATASSDTSAATSDTASKNPPRRARRPPRLMPRRPAPTLQQRPRPQAPRKLARARKPPRIPARRQQRLPLLPQRALTLQQPQPRALARARSRPRPRAPQQQRLLPARLQPVNPPCPDACGSSGQFHGCTGELHEPSSSSQDGSGKDCQDDNFTGGFRSANRVGQVERHGVGQHR